MSRDLEILLDIQYTCREIQEFIAGLDYETFRCHSLAVNEPKRQLHHQRADRQRTAMKPEDQEMPDRGAIIRINLNPTQGREQTGG
mgnify:CR=1 FL=1